MRAKSADGSKYGEEEEEQEDPLPEGTHHVYKVGSDLTVVVQGDEEWWDNPWVDMEYDESMTSVVFEGGDTPTQYGDRVPLEIARGAWDAFANTGFAAVDGNESRLNTVEPAVGEKLRREK